MDVSIIIVNFRTPQLVIECIESVYEKTEGISFEIIVVENGSGDNSSEIIRKQLGTRVKLIVSSENLGFGRANNLGAKYAQGEYLFLLNSDTILVNNAIKILFEFAKATSKVGVVGGNLLTSNMKASPSYCLEFDNINKVKKNAKWLVILFNRIKISIKGKIGRNVANTLGQVYNFGNEAIKVAYIFGADMMLPRKIFSDMGGFDSDFFMYGEEQDLSWRIKEAGYQIWNVPEAKIIHMDGASMKKEASFNTKQYKMRMNGKMVYFYKRHGKNGSKRFYEYKMLEFNRTMLVAKVLKRRQLYELTEKQKICLEETYRAFLNKI